MRSRSRLVCARLFEYLLGARPFILILLLLRRVRREGVVEQRRVLVQQVRVLGAPPPAEVLDLREQGRTAASRTHCRDNTSINVD